MPLSHQLKALSRTVPIELWGDLIHVRVIFWYMFYINKHTRGCVMYTVLLQKQTDNCRTYKRDFQEMQSTDGDILQEL